MISLSAVLFVRAYPDDMNGQVLVESVPLDAAFEKALNDRLVLVFTGKQRLARSDVVLRLRSQSSSCLCDGRRWASNELLTSVGLGVFRACLCFSLSR